MKILSASFFCLLSAGGSTFAQQTLTAPGAAKAASPAAIAPSVAVAVAATAVPDAAGKYMLREGSDVNLRFAQSLSSKTAAEGDPVTLELVDDLKVGETVVAKAGSKAIGEVSAAKKSGMMGQAGDLSIRLEYLKVGDTKVKLRGVKGKQGESGVGATVALTVLFGPIGLIKHGKNVEIKEGQSLHAFVGDDIALVSMTTSDK